MWFKKKEALLGSIVLLAIFSLYSCVNEPTIEPVQRPFSTVRLINLSQNVNPMSVTIIKDGNPYKSINSIELASPTSYFNIFSGKDTVVVKDNSGKTVFNNTVDIISYERSTIVFAGTYSENIDNNNFGVFQIDEAEIYKSIAPEPDSLAILFIHAANSVDTINVEKYRIDAHITIPPDTLVHDTTYMTYDNPLVYGNVHGIANVAPGSYSFDFYNGSDSTLAKSTPVYNFSAGYRYYIYIYGSPDSLLIKDIQELPPPVESRY